MNDLKQALDETVVEQWYRTYCDTELIEHEFSEEFDLKMERIVRQMGKKDRRNIRSAVKKAVIVLVAAVLLGTITTMAYKPLRNWFFDLFVEKGSDNNKVNFVSGEISGDEVDMKFTYYYPGYIPEGFEAVEENDYDGMHIIVYSDGEHIFTFAQSRVTATAKVDNGGESEEVKIGDLTGWISHDGSEFRVTWSNGIYNFVVSGYLTKSEIISVSNSLKTTKF